MKKLDFYKAVLGEFYTIEDIAKKLKVGKPMAYLRTREDGWPTHKTEVGRRKFWEKKSVDNYLKKVKK